MHDISFENNIKYMFIFKYVPLKEKFELATN